LESSLFKSLSRFSDLNDGCDINHSSEKHFWTKIL